VSGNSGVGGGGIYSDNGALTVSRSTLSGNSGFAGGAIAAFGHDAQVTVRRSTLSRNSAQFGGAVLTAAIPPFDGAIVGEGGVTVTQSTLSGNSAPEGGAIYGSATLKSTIVANSHDGVSCNNGPAVISLGFNLADDGSCNLTAQGDKPNTEPLLRPLDDYGGRTKTFALPKTSPAIDAGRADGTTTDQRGLPRIVDYPNVLKAAGGDNSDIGAFELQAP
jgi:predicted outer membrane repeat protein